MHYNLGGSIVTMNSTEVCIVGAGPAGATLAHFLAKAGIEHVLIDQAAFPRDKVCGDGITLDVVNVLKRISPQLLEQFVAESDIEPSWGFSFHAPGGGQIRHDFKDDGFNYAPFYTARRLTLDHFLVKTLNPEYTDFRPLTKVTALHYDPEHIRVGIRSNDGVETEIKARYVIGAEGEKPVVSKLLGLKPYRHKDHLIGALRVYYQNVEGFHPHRHLEFFFDKRLLPGYFWAFPLSNGEANVGLGMVSREASLKKANLKKLLTEVMTTNPAVAPMFAKATPLEKPLGWGLPTITPRRQIAGKRFALIGDAAGMIEPFTGKGIGPGMMSARICSEHLIEAVRHKTEHINGYPQHMYRYYRSEAWWGYTFQKTLRYPPALNALAAVHRIPAFSQWAHRKMTREWHQWI